MPTTWRSIASTGSLHDRAVSQYRRRNVSAALARFSAPGITFIWSTMAKRPSEVRDGAAGVGERCT